MNFEFLQNYKSRDEAFQDAYDKLASLLKEAEQCYWSEQVKCAGLLQRSAEEICRIYNRYFELGFPAEASLGEMLCYDGTDSHDRKVSTFLCAIGDEQRNRLNLIRALGDDCMFLEANPMHRDAQADKLYLNLKKMMIAMAECIGQLFAVVEQNTAADGLEFEEEEVEGGPPKPSVVPKKSFWDKWKKKS